MKRQFRKVPVMCSDVDSRIADAQQQLMRTQRKIDKLESEKLYAPTLEKIIQQFTKKTGFTPYVGKTFYKPEYNAVLAEFLQNYNYGVSKLATYKNPSHVGPDSPLLIHVDDASSIDDTVDRLIEGLIDIVQSTFYSIYTLRPYVDVPFDQQATDDYVINSILDEASVANRKTAKNFIQNLLKDGVVVNYLPSRIKEAEEHYNI